MSVPLFFFLLLEGSTCPWFPDSGLGSQAHGLYRRRPAGMPYLCALHGSDRVPQRDPSESFALTDRAVRRKRVECQELHPGDTKNLPATLRGGVELLGN